MPQELVVRILGDASSLERALKRSSKATARFDKSMRGSTLSVKGFHRSLTGLTAGLLGGAGLAVALRATFSEVTNAQKVMAQTNAVLKSTGGLAGVSAKDVDRLASSLSQLSGVDDELIASGENVLLTFTKVRNTFGEGNDIFDQATRAALDMSTALGTDLQGSVIRIGKALQDPIRGVTALRRVGVNFSKSQVALIKSLVESGRALEAQKLILRELQVEFGGSAKAAGNTLAGRLGRLRESALNLGASLLQTLLPAITPIVDQMVAWLQDTKNQKQLMSDFKDIVEVLASVLRVLRDAFRGLNEVTGSTRETFKLLLVGFVAYKGLKLVAYTAALRKQTLLLGGAWGKVLVPLAAAIAAYQELKHPKRMRERLETSPRIQQAIRDRLQFEAPPRTPEPFLGASFIARRTAKEAKQAAQVAREIATAITKARRAAGEAFRQVMQDRAAFAVERAAATATLTDDLAALNKYNALLARRIRGGHGTLELEREQFQVQQQIADVLQQQAEAQKAARTARQFRLLGFGPEGQDLVPGIGALKRQLASVNDVLAGSFLDTKKTRSLISHIRKVLSGGMGSVAEEVRERIAQILADLKAQLKQSSVDVTRFQKTARGQFTLAGAAGGGRGVVISGGVHLHGVQNVQQLENELAKRRKQRARQRRSTR